jgi:hypothetical protein
MHDVQIVHGFKATDYLDKDAPNILFGKSCLIFLMLSYFLEKISIISVLHDYTIEDVKIKLSYHKA